ncbi:hypothetical protein ACFXJO_05675 [Streptomyces lavendulae]|uniref:hypothetical protein n=1 Tax=Streptomyces lavendulae TaxID=1914 RepID=UPI00369EDAEB
MIEYVPRSGPPEAMHCPTIICDTCRTQVHGAGNIVWMVKSYLADGPRQQSPLYAAHKGPCDRALEAWLKTQYPEGDWLLNWEELGDFLRQLAHNAEHAFADDTKGEYHQLIIKQPRNDPHEQIPEAPSRH